MLLWLANLGNAGSPALTDAVTKQSGAGGHKHGNVLQYPRPRPDKLDDEVSKKLKPVIKAAEQEVREDLAVLDKYVATGDVKETIQTQDEEAAIYVLSEESNQRKRAAKALLNVAAQLRKLN